MSDIFRPGHVTRNVGSADLDRHGRRVHGLAVGWKARLFLIPLVSDTGQRFPCLLDFPKHHRNNGAREFGQDSAFAWSAKSTSETPRPPGASDGEVSPAPSDTNHSPSPVPVRRFAGKRAMPGAKAVLQSPIPRRDAARPGLRADRPGQSGGACWTPDPGTCGS